MILTPRRKRMAIVGLVLVYIYYFYSYNWDEKIPAILETREVYSEATQILANLEVELANLYRTRTMLDSMRVGNERYKDFIDNKMDMHSAIDYMNTLINVLDEDISSVSISTPREQITIEPNYYQTSFSFNARLSYDSLMDFVELIEGGNKPVRITSLSVAPSDISEEQMQEHGSRELSIFTDGIDLVANIELAMYSLDQESVDAFYEVSTNKLERFGYFDGISFVVPDELIGDFDVPSVDTGGVQEPPETRLTGRQNISISLGSYLAGTRNFSISGLRPDSGEVIRYRTRDPQDIVLRVNRNAYHIEVRDGNIGVENFTGAVTGSDLNVNLREEVPNISENENLAINLTIINESDYNILVSQNRQSSRINVYDRNRNTVLTQSQTDKIFIN